MAISRAGMGKPALIFVGRQIEMRVRVLPKALNILLLQKGVSNAFDRQYEGLLGTGDHSTVPLTSCTREVAAHCFEKLSTPSGRD